jgi:opacity protein-like surface antigen
VNTKRCLFLVPLAVVAILAASTTAAGQLPGAPGHHIVRIGFGGGVSVPTSHAADALKNGINGQAYLLLDPGLGFPLRFNAGYQKFDYKAIGLDPLTTDGNSQILSGVAGLSINLIQLGPLRPYLTAGLGAFEVKDEFTTAGTSASTSAMKFGIDGGGGLALRLGRLEAFVEGRVQNVYTDQGAIDAKSIRAVPLTFGILF